MISTDAEYKEFRDGLYDPKYSIEKHRHHAYYGDDGILQRKCAKCHGDLWDSVHVAEVPNA